jgi:hypothetical protein
VDQFAVSKPSGTAQGRRQRLGDAKSRRRQSVAVESGDRAFRWTGATGTADSRGTPRRDETPYFLASIDKLYNATIVWRLHERGPVRLDESIATCSRRSSEDCIG